MPPAPLWGFTQPIRGIPGAISRDAERPGRDANHTNLHLVARLRMTRYTTIPPYAFLVYKGNLSLPLQLLLHNSRKKSSNASRCFCQNLHRVHTLITTLLRYLTIELFKIPVIVTLTRPPESGP